MTNNYHAVDIPWLLGKKGNGKDTVLRMLSTTLGDEGGGYCTVLEEHMLEAGSKSRGPPMLQTRFGTLW